jgi:hypothetical protein
MAKAGVNLSDILPKDYYLIQKAKKDQKKIDELWNGVNYVRYLDLIYRRLDLLKQLHKIYPKLELQSEALKGWRTKLYNFDEFEFNAELHAPAVHYRILPNEIVFEIDCDENLDEARRVAKKITRDLITFGAKPFVGFSGRRGYHIHVIIAPPDGDVFNFAQALGCKEFTLKLFELLKDLINCEHLDDGVMTAEHHTIRSFYSLNIKGRKWKKPVFGDSYSIWILSKNMWFRVFEELKKDYIEAEILNELRKFEEVRVKVRSTGKYKWIKWILEHPEVIKDGRERLLWLAIVPYLVLQGYNDAQIEDICQRWIEKSGAEWKSKYRCKVRSMIKHCREHERKTGQKWWPISLDKLVEMFPDLGYLSCDLRVNGDLGN